jgi:YesN/AraC family two-component response regulator
MQRILIIDDERDVRDSVKCVLDLAGYEAVTAENATDALEQLGRTPTDLVITDIIMPKINGVQAIQSIRKAFPSFESSPYPEAATSASRAISPRR